MKKTIELVGLVMALLTATVCRGESGMSMRSITAAEGLSDLVVNKIFKDSRGYVWLGTGQALDRYDGNRIKSYAIPGENLNLKRIKGIAEGSKGELYVGNAAGLFRLSGRWSELEPIFETRIGASVNALATRGDTLYVGSDSGLYLVDTPSGKLTHHLLAPDVMASVNRISSLYITPEGEVWLTTAKGLHCFNPHSGKFTTYAKPFASSLTAVDGYGKILFIGTYGNGLEVFDREEKHFLDSGFLGNDIVTSVDVAEKEGRVYVGTDGDGVYIIDMEKRTVDQLSYRNKDAESELRSNSVYSLLKDDRGILWVGYYQDGADYTPYLQNSFDVYRWPGFIDTRNAAVRAVAIDGPRKLIGTREGLFYIDEATGRTASFRMPRIRSNIIFSIRKIRERYYVGTYNGGMYVFDPVTMQLTDFEPSESVFRTGSIFQIVEDRVGDVWVATSKGLYRFDRDYTEGSGRFTLFTHSNSQLPEGNVYEIYFDSTGRGWICAENGIAVWDGTRLRADGFPQGFVNNHKIRDVMEDREHNLYFLPDRGPIYRSNLALTKTEELTGASLATNQAPTFIAEDQQGGIWIGSEQGLLRYDGKDNFRFFNAADGLPNKVFTYCQPVLDSNGDLWMGNTRGLVKLDFKRFRQQGEMKSLPLITDVESNGRSVGDRMRKGRDSFELTLGSNENNLTVSYANFDYINPEDLVVEYYLEGVDRGWQSHSGSRKIQYFDLKPGRYTLHLRQAGDPMSETRLRVKVDGAFNFTVTALALMVLVLGGLSLYFYRKHRTNSEALAVTEAAMAKTREEAERAAAEERQRRYQTTRLTDEECRRLFKKLEAVMKAERPYTNPDLKSADLAAMVGTSTHALSFLFNQYLDKSYYDYVNEYRVEAFKRFVDEADTSKYTLTAMSQKCGFSSRASFFRHFKAVTGITPSDYLKKIKG